jgi:hypothetical protein
MRHGADYPSCIYDRIHPCTEEEEEATSTRYKTSHVETNHKQKAPKMTEQIPLVQLITLQIIRKS